MLNDIGQYQLPDGRVLDVIHLDFETYYDSRYSLSHMTYPDYIFDERFEFHGVGIAVNDGEVVYYRPADVTAAIMAIDWPNVVLAGQNLMFDASILAWLFEARAAFYIDTRSLSRALYPGQKADLDVMARREFPNDPSKWKGKELADFKGMRQLNDAQQEVMGGYCEQDVEVTRHLLRAYVPRMPVGEMRVQDATLRLYLEPKFILDESLIQSYLDKELEEEHTLVKRSGHPKSTFASNPKFVALLESLGLKVPQKISPSTGKITDALAQSDPALIRLMAENPQHKALWDARRAVKSTGQKRKAEHLIRLARHFNGQVPSPLSYAAAHTLRWGGTQKVNLQSMKRGSDLRKSLRAPPGHLVYVVDSSNIEARMVAWLAGELAALDMFRQGVDTYNDMASKIYGYAVDRKARDEHGNLLFEEEGNVGKTAKLGLGFGMGAYKFQQTLAAGPMGSPPIYKPFDFCQQAVDIFRNDHPYIVSYWGQMMQAIYDMILPGTNYQLGALRVQHEAIMLPNGLALRYPNIRYEEVEIAQLVGEEVTTRQERNLYCDRKDGDARLKLYGGILAENVTQRAARDVVAEQIMNCMDAFDDIELGLMVHDEGVFIMPDDEPEARLQVLTDIFSTPPAWCSDIPLAAEGGFDECYSK